MTHQMEERMLKCLRAMQKRKIDKSVINLSSLAKCYWDSIDGLTSLAV